MSEQEQSGLITKIVKLFLSSKLAIIFIIFSMLLGAAAIILMPKEEDPQIVVPMADVVVSAPGVGAAEINKLVATPLSQMLWQIKGIEDVYSTAYDGKAVITARFFVGEDQERSMVRLFTKINMNLDVLPPIVSNWVVKPISINDVPIVNIAFYSDKYNDFAVRRVAEEALAHLNKITNISKTYIVGGRKLQTLVAPDPDKLNAYHISPIQIYNAIKNSDVATIAGNFNQNNQQFVVSSDSFFTSQAQLAHLMVGVYNNKPVYLYDLAKVSVGPSLSHNYSFITLHNGKSYPATTIGLAKKSGSNAVTVANNITKTLQQLKNTIIPTGIHTKIIRDYGQTAHDKVNNLLYSLGLAILTVIIVLIFSLGWRESIIVATSVPISFALALFVDYLLGYSINRVTLFALILSLGLVVDDPITNIENIQRHIILGKQKIFGAIITAVNEVLPPVIMASLTIIVSFIPLFFITGMMGPYMSPMAATVPLTIIVSTICALTVVPWMAYVLLRNRQKQHQQISLDNHSHDVTPAWLKNGYRKIVEPLLQSYKKRWFLFGGIIAALGLCAALVLLQKVPLKLLPFDNKNELQLVVNMPEGSTLEQTNRTINQLGNYLHTVPEIASFTTYVGQPSPMDFNGMVRHYYLRQADNLADIRINLVDKDARRLTSHEIGLKIRKAVTEIAKTNNAKLALVEMPPGPPVLATIVGEVHGTPSTPYSQLIASAKKIEALLRQQQYVVDINDSSQTPHPKLNFVINKEKAAFNGISSQQIITTLQLALGSTTPMVLHKANERQPLAIKIELPRQDRSSVTDLEQLTVPNTKGSLVPLIELGTFVQQTQTQPIYQKNLHNVVYVYANTAGRPPVDVVLKMENILKNHPLVNGISVNWAGEGALKITARVFRDMGIGFAAALLAIYILLFLQTDSFIIPLVMMIAIPLTIIGIIPGFWLLNIIANHPVGGFPTPIFFTATSMIGMIALGGIVIRNSLILINFIDNSVKSGTPFKQAVLESGAVRLRPIVLTAITAALGAWPITLDPIFSGLAWALIFGLFASTSFSLVVVPVIYYAIYKKKFSNI